MNKEESEKKQNINNFNKLTSEFFCKELFGNFPLGTAFINAEWKIVYCSGMFIKLLRLPEVYEGLNLINLFDKDYQQIIQEHLVNLSCNEETPSMEYLLRRYDGTSFWAELYGTPQFEADGTLAGIYALFYDISDRKETEEALGESRQQFQNLYESIKEKEELLYKNQQELQALVENSPDIIVRHSLDGRVIYANKITEEIFGNRVEDVLDKTSTEIVSTKDMQQLRNNILKVAGTGNAIEVELFVDSLSREAPVYHNIRIIPEYDQKGEMVSILVIGRDISKQKKADQEHTEHLRSLENMDMINRVIQEAINLEQMMSDLLDSLLSIFNCDRAFLVYPCDPETSEWQVPMERTKPEYPGVFRTGRTMAIDPEVAETFRILCEAKGPVKFGHETDYPLPTEVAEEFGIKSFMATIIYSKVGKPWELGIHQCSYDRVWTQEEEKLFKEIGLRISDGLTSMLAYRNLQESELRYREIFENTSDGIFVTEVIEDNNFKLLDINPVSERIFGLEYHEMIGKPVSRFYNHGIFGSIFHQLHLCLENRQPINFEAEFETATGYYYLFITIIPVIDSGNTIHRLIGVIHNITEHKKLEKALTEKEREFRTLLENIPDYIARYDKNCIRTYLNPAMESLFIKPLPELINTTPDRYSPLNNPAEYIRKIKHVIDTGIKCSIEMLFFYSGGEQRFGHIIIVPEYGEGGKITGALTIGRDVTERKLAEEALRESERRYREIFNNVSEGLYMLEVTEDGRFRTIDVNPALEKLTGISRSVSVGKTQEEIVPKEVADMVNKKYRRCVETGEEIEEELELELPLGKRIFKSIIIPTRNESGQIYRIVGISRDITESKQAEELIKNQKEYLDTLLNTLSDVVVNVKMPERIVEYINSAVTSMLGYSQDEVIGGETKIYYQNENDFLLYGELVEKTIADGKNKFQIELGLRRKDGSLIWADISSTIIYKKGNLERIISIVRDITEHKQAEEKIRILTRGIEQSPVIVVITDKEGVVEYVNPKFTEVTGFSEDEVSGEKLSILKKVDLQKKGYDELWNTISAGKEWSGKFLNKKKNGELFWQSSLISPVKDKNNKINHYVAIMEDITEKIKADSELMQYRQNLENLVEQRTSELNKMNKLLQEQIAKQKEAEKKIQQTLEKEQETNELRARFISTASHEFRTPLTTIYSSTQLLERYGRTWSEEIYMKQLDRIKEYIHFLIEVMDDVLIINKVDTDKLKFRPKEINLNTLCNNFVEEIKFILLPSHKLVFKTRLNSEKYLLDDKLLKYIVGNLLTNAVKYSPGGGKIEFFVIEDNNEVTFKISDEGIGIPVDDQQNLYETFHRGKNVGDIKGTGLGLSIVKKAVKLHKGKLKFQSNEGKGTTFTVILTLRNK